MFSERNEQETAAQAIPDSEHSLAEHWQRAAAQIQPASSNFVWLTLFGVAVLSILGFISYRLISVQFQELSNERAELIHGREMMGRVTTIRDLLQAGATSVRFYVANGEQDYLLTTQSMLERYPQELQQLEQMIGTEAERRDFQRLQVLSDAVFNVSREWVQQYQRDRAASAVASQDWDAASRETVIALRQFVAMWRELERAKLLNADQRSVQQLIHARQYAMGALVVGASLMLALGWLLRAYLLRRQQTEASLRVTSTLWSGTLESLAQGVGLYTLDSRLMFWNPQYVEFHGLTAGQLYPGIPLVQVIRASGRLQAVDVEGEIADVARAAELIRAGGTFLSERQRIDGRVIQIAGRPMGRNYYVVTLTDVTAIRRSEQLSHDQATRLTAIMDSVSDAIITLNVSGSIESWSDSARRMFGYEASEIVRRHVSMLLAEPFASAREGYLQRCLSSSEAVLTGHRIELDARHRDGSLFPVDLSLSEMQIDGRRILVSIVRDITERRAVERMKSEFVATVSHELRTPLTSIAGSLALLAGDTSGELPVRMQRLLEIANRNSQRLTVLINDILELEKAESGKLYLRLQPQTLLPVIDQAIDANRAYGQRFNVQLVLQTDGNESMVLLDEGRIMQVLANLLSNAIKFSPAGAAVLIVVKQDEDVVRVTIHDDGPGVPEDFRDRIFVRFAQADSSNTRRMGGTGLGLAISKSLIEHHGGKIGFDSGRSAIGGGQGASFWFQLPLIPASHAAVPELSVDSLAGERVLICEDDPDIAELLSKLLQQHGGVAEIATSVASAHQALRRQTPDLILVDMNLPDGDGLSLIAELRLQENLREVPIIILSAVDCAELDAGVLHSLGIKCCLRKPAEVRVVHQAVVHMLRRLN